MRRVLVARAPPEEAVVIGGPAAQVPAVGAIAEAAPEGQLLERDRRDRRVLAQPGDDPLHLLRAVELVDVDLPQPVAGRPLRVGAALLVLLAVPPAVGAALVLGGDDRDLALRVLLGLEAPKLLERVVARVPVGRGDVLRRRGGPFDEDDLVGEGIQRAERRPREWLAVEDD